MATALGQFPRASRLPFAAGGGGPLGGALYPRRVRRRAIPRGWVVGGGIAALAIVVLGIALLPGLMAGDPQLEEPVAVARITLESDTEGTAVVMVFHDRAGRDVPLVGQLDVELREPDGARWESTRQVNKTDFKPLPAGSLLQGRVGYRIVVPPQAWTRPPRRGGQAGIQLNVVPRNGAAFRYQGTDIFP